MQVVIDLGVAACVRFDLGAPTSYADAFRRLAAAGIVEASLAERLARAAGFRNVVAHAYDNLDMARVFRAASEDGPAKTRDTDDTADHGGDGARPFEEKTQARSLARSTAASACSTVE